MILALGLIGFSVLSFANDLNTKSKIDRVKVFLTGAQIERSATVNLKAGRNRIVIKEISAKLDEKSIQVRFQNAVKLMSVSTELDYKIFEGTQGRIGKLNDSLRIIEERLQELADIKSAIKSEKDLLNKNKELRGANKNMTVEELQKAADFYRKRMQKINTELTGIQRETGKLNERKWVIQAKLEDLNFKESTRSNQIIIIMDSKTDQKVDLDIEYFVSGCGWEPNYNLIAKDLSGKITMEYKAKVFNDTGNDWDKVEMVLSTGNPNLSATFPELSPWYLKYMTYLKSQTKTISTNNAIRGHQDQSNTTGWDYRSNGNLEQNRGDVNYFIPNNTMNWDMVVQDNERKVNELQMQLGNKEAYYDGVPLQSGKRRNYFKQDKASTVSYRTIEVSHLSSEFDIEEHYSIPSDRKPYLVDIKEHQLDGTFEYVAIPKMEKDAFLLAQIPGWEQLDLVPGPTRVYFDGTYVGESWIDTRNVEDTLGLSFGRDSKIYTNRKLLTEFSNKKVVGNNRKDSYTYEITIKNSRNIGIQVDLHDQVPISQDSDITVYIDEISEALKEEHTGILSWKVNLGPNETKKFRISFTIKYPKNKKIQVRSFRKLYAPKF